VAVIPVVRQRVPMLDALTLEDRTRPAPADVGRAPIRSHFTERELWFGLAAGPSVLRPQSARPRPRSRARDPRATPVRPRATLVRPRSMIS